MKRHRTRCQIRAIGVYVKTHIPLHNVQPNDPISELYRSVVMTFGSQTGRGHTWGNPFWAEGKWLYIFHDQSPRKKIDHEIFSTAILSLPLIQEGQLSVSGERMCTILVNLLEG